MEIPVKAVHRGICSFTHVYASSGDLLGLGSKDKSFTFSDSSALVVYPAVFPVLTDDLLRTSSDLEAGRNGYMEDVTLLKDVYKRQALEGYFPLIIPCKSCFVC